MLLRTSSTPVTGTPLSSFAESPSRDFDNNNCNKNVLFHGLHHLNLTTFPCGSSPGRNNFGLKGFRKARSEGNLEGLASSSCDIEEFRSCYSQKKSSCKQYYNSMLRSAPSFSIFHTFDEVEREEKNGQDPEREEPLSRAVTIGECIEAEDNGDFSFGKKINMGLIEEEGEDEGIINGIQDLNFEEVEPPSPPMYLATGLGIDFAAGFDSVQVVDLTPMNFDENGNIEEYYEKMVDEYPCHPLILRNYAQLLKSKGDLHGAEDYYHRATLADPGDGEILMQYAKVVWELHHDQVRALPYFERAVEAAPQDSNILAAYASFLWEIDDDGQDEAAQQGHIGFTPFPVEKEDSNKLDNSVPKKGIEPVSPSSLIASGLRIDVPKFTTDSGGNSEDYHWRMVEENPCNPLVLRNYAQFLYQSKGDFQGAEEYYSRAVQADPADGEIMSQYAKLVWALHHDHDKASCYFELAVQATPGDSNVLAAYARFLWETEEDDATQRDHFQVPLHEGAITAANS